MLHRKLEGESWDGVCECVCVCVCGGGVNGRDKNDCSGIAGLGGVGSRGRHESRHSSSCKDAMCVQCSTLEPNRTEPSRMT